jgi:hypothetical protein
VISLFPQKSITLVLPIPLKDVVMRLEKVAIRPQDVPQQYTPLMGWVKGEDFQVALSSRRPNGFAPVATGRIDQTSTGCLIFLNYRLLPSTRFYLAFWSLMTTFSGIAMAVYYKNFLLWLASFCVLVFINGTAWANFYLHLKTLHDTLLKALE